MNNTRRRLTAAAGCLMLILLAAGCAALSPPASKQAALEERVKDYMQAQIDQKWDKAYAFFDTFSRQEVPRDSYMQKPRQAAYTDFTIEEITMLPSGDQATVKVKIDISFMGYELKQAPHQQEWVKENGSWFVKIPAKSQESPFGSRPEKQE
jgi:hypothetical protein